MGTNLLVGSLFQPLWYSCARSSCILSSIKLGLRQTPIDGTSTFTGSAASMLYTGGRRGIAPIEMCTETQYPCEVTVSSHASLCKWMPSSGQSSWFLLVASTAKMPQYVRDLFGSLFILLLRLRIQRFIDAWFDYWFWQVSISYDYADIWEWLKNFLGFLYYHFSRISTK